MFEMQNGNDTFSALSIDPTIKKYSAQYWSKKIAARSPSGLKAKIYVLRKYYARTNFASKKSFFIPPRVSYFEISAYNIITIKLLV